MNSYKYILEALKNQCSEDVDVYLRRGWYNMITCRMEPYTDFMLIELMRAALEYTEYYTFELECIITDILNRIDCHINIHTKDILGESIYSLCKKKNLQKIENLIYKKNNIVALGDIKVGI